MIDRLAPLKVVEPVKGHDPWLDGGLITRTVKKLQKEFEALRNDFNARLILKTKQKKWALLNWILSRGWKDIACRRHANKKCLYFGPETAIFKIKATGVI